MKCGSKGGTLYFNALEPLSDADIEPPVPIRGEPHSVMQAINRQIAHYAYHCGQIVSWRSTCGPANGRRSQCREVSRKILTRGWPGRK